MPADRTAFASLTEAQKALFRTGATRPEAFRRAMLRRLGEALDEWEAPLCEALHLDLRKSHAEALLTEWSVVRSEIRHHLRHLARWMRPERRSTPLKMFPSSSRLLPEPRGTALIVAPWNYPLQLALMPLVGAISAGCTAVLKPSPEAPHTAETLARMIASLFDESYIAVVRGDAATCDLLLDAAWDLIFFTGSPASGRKVMERAARHLTPVVLELGGKSPCIVDRHADLELAARRIAWGKTLNAGQTCVAPDYLLLHRSHTETFPAAYARALHRMLGDDPQQSPHYARMVNDRAFDRVAAYLRQGTIRLGGAADRADRYIEPTLLTEVDPESAVMQEEIFGPILPVLPFDTLDEVEAFVNSRAKPLALYYFGPEAEGRRLLGRIPSGGACLNDTILQIVNPELPFGGVGSSGFGRYHGRDSFEAFTHRRAVLSTPTWIDLPFRYMPYPLLRWIRHLL